jgi:hypothetical protein
VTYVPVTNPGPTGRKPKDVPAALLAHLRHSYDTGRRWTVALRTDEDRAHADELRRACIRAGYRHFPDRSVRCKVTADSVTYWMTDKKTRGTR